MIQYESLIIEVIEFLAEDVIITSTSPTTPEEPAG